MPWPQTGATIHHAHKELLNNGRAMKGLVVYYIGLGSMEGMALMTSAAPGSGLML